MNIIPISLMNIPIFLDEYSYIQSIPKPQPIQFNLKLVSMIL